MGSIPTRIATIPLWEILRKKEENNLIKVSRKEVAQLVKMGVVYGENGISRTHGHHKKYFLCESRKNLSLLSKIRQDSIICTVN